MLSSLTSVQYGIYFKYKTKIMNKELIRTVYLSDIHIGSSIYNFDFNKLKVVTNKVVSLKSNGNTLEVIHTASVLRKTTNIVLDGSELTFILNSKPANLDIERWFFKLEHAKEQGQFIMEQATYNSLKELEKYKNVVL